MDPVRVKLYGLFWQTKKRYLTQQAVAVALLLAVLLICFAVPRLDGPLPRGGFVEVPEGSERERPPPLSSGIVQLVAFLHTVPWIVAGLLVLIGVETVIVLRCFARKEAEQRAPAPSAPASTTQPTNDPPVAAPVSEKSHG